jgi:hypothetical protein
MTNSKLSKNGEDGRTGVCMREGTTSRLMTADRPYGGFYDFHSASPQYFGYTTNSRWTCNVILKRFQVSIFLPWKCNKYYMFSVIYVALVI